MPTVHQSEPLSSLAKIEEYSKPDSSKQKFQFKHGNQQHQSQQQHQHHASLSSPKQQEEQKSSLSPIATLNQSTSNTSANNASAPIHEQQQQQQQTGYVSLLGHRSPETNPFPTHAAHRPIKQFVHESPIMRDFFSPTADTQTRQGKSDNGLFAAQNYYSGGARPLAGRLKHAAPASATTPHGYKYPK
jgi:hypothetical protein